MDSLVVIIIAIAAIMVAVASGDYDWYDGEWWHTGRRRAGSSNREIRPPTTRVVIPRERRR